MADFETAYAITMKAEGGYANDPVDTGGETYAGVSRINNPRWAGWGIVDTIKATRPKDLDSALGASALLRELVHSIYRSNYWDVNRLGSITNQAIANQLFDIGVNMGTGMASRFLQEALNLSNANQVLYRDIAIDGVVGKQTLELVNNHPRPVNVLKLIVGLKIERYMEICRKAPAQERFMNSWLSRIPVV